MFSMFLSGFYVVICFLLLLVVLLQQGKGGGMAAAFGGSGSASAFGARAGATVLTRATAVLGTLFMVGAMFLASWVSAALDRSSAAWRGLLRSRMPHQRRPNRPKSHRKRPSNPPTWHRYAEVAELADAPA